jgi:hypothetical protein
MGGTIATLGETFLAFDGSLDGDVGRFLERESLKNGRERMTDMKAQRLEVVRVSKSGKRCGVSCSCVFFAAECLTGQY